MFDGALFHLYGIMSLMRYREITASLRFTNIAAPTMNMEEFIDHFHKVRKMIDVFN